ncbi:MAG: efflux RND transporter periplasmic adaptor subunit [Bacteroidota bacterium]|nr:efflux RND transporter periplasmic adaptor subunit [Bacteroidota bacterium]
MKVYILLLVAGLFAAACSSEEQPASQDSQSDLNQQQKVLADVKMGRMELRRIAAAISCTGEIEVPPQGIASVTAPLGGFIVDTDMVPGTQVKKGSRLARLSNPEYIVLQQSYLETAGQLQFAERDYTRQKTLQEQDATAEKKLQESESTYKVLHARLSSLKEQLSMIGVNLGELQKGKIQSVVDLRAPIHGYVTAVNHHPGQFVEPREVIFEIVNLDDLHLHLNIFEKDVARVRAGQSVRFHAPGDAGTYWGEVSLVSPQRNETVRTFDVHGHIEKEDEALKPGMYVEAEIFASDDSVYAVPERAIVQNLNNFFVITEEEGRYLSQPVEAGEKMDGWVAIRNYETLKDKNIVIDGATRVFAAMARKTD